MDTFLTIMGIVGIFTLGMQFNSFMGQLARARKFAMLLGFVGGFIGGKSDED